MNILTIILNRVYAFLTKVKNQSPFLGTVILVTILINTLLFDLVFFIYIVLDKANKINELVYFLILALIFIFVYLYAVKRRHQIVESNISPSLKINFLVIGVFCSL